MEAAVIHGVRSIISRTRCFITRPTELGVQNGVVVALLGRSTIEYAFQCYTILGALKGFTTRPRREILWCLLHTLCCWKSPKETVTYPSGCETTNRRQNNRCSVRDVGLITTPPHESEMRLAFHTALGRGRRSATYSRRHSWPLASSTHEFSN